MGVILLNCITLGMYQPCNDEVCDSIRCQVLAGFDHFIFAFFAIEMCIKVTALGLIGKTTYLAETWNRLDMFIVIAGAVEYGVNTENLSLSAIRTIRVLRPLRAINRIPSMRILVMLLLDTLPMLGNVLLLCFFVFFIFGIIGVQLWAGLLRQRCFLDLPENVTTVEYLPDYYIPLSKRDFICGQPEDGGMTKCKDSLPSYIHQEQRCNLSALPFDNNTNSNESGCINWNQYYTVCKAGVYNPFQGAISFDNIGLAWVAIFQVISLAGWVNIMYYVQDAHSFWDWIYFVSLIVIGAFFMVNLCLVVIATQFSETKKRETERMMQERKRFHSSSTLASNSEPGGCYEEILKYMSHLFRRAKRKLHRLFRRAHGRRQRKVTPERAISLRRKHKKKKATLHLHHHHYHTHHHYHLSNASNVGSSPMAPRASPEISDVEPLASPRRPNHLMVPMDNRGNRSAESLQAITYTSDFLSPHDPNLLKPSQQSSPNHLSVAVPIKRASSFNSAVNRSKNLTVPTMDTLAVPVIGAKLSTHSLNPMPHKGLLATDYDAKKKMILQPKKKKVPTATLR